jgi:uncharacterized protein
MEAVRTCLGCRARADKSSLTRVVARDGEVVVDHSATLPGRGAWVHPTLECVEKALTRKAFGRALKADGALVVSAATAQQLRQHSSRDSKYIQPKYHNQSDHPKPSATDVP